MKIETLQLLRKYIEVIEDHMVKHFHFHTEVVDVGRKLSLSLLKEERFVMLQTAREHFPKGAKVKVCAAPQCGHSANCVGEIDIVGFFDSDEQIGISIIREDGGACGPFRVNELTHVTKTTD